VGGPVNSAPVLMVKRDGPLCWLTLNRQERLNAFNQDLRVALKESLIQAREDSATRVVIITGAGRAFCAGGDLKIMAELKRQQAGFDEFLPFLTLGEEIVKVLYDYPLPTIAMVNGPAAGAGLSLALACDLRFASDHASFAMSFVKIGLHPDWGSTFSLPRTVGFPNALEMAWLGEPIHAERALQMGLVHRIIPHENLKEKTRDLALTLAKYPPDLLRDIKASLRQSMFSDLEQCIRRERAIQEARWNSPESTSAILNFNRK
jgi:2-(1,2-epoxy-1,2-dihydrophenyl)acetyl-CoA isomerase